MSQKLQFKSRELSRWKPIEVINLFLGLSLIVRVTHSNPLTLTPRIYKHSYDLWLISNIDYSMSPCVIIIINIFVCFADDFEFYLALMQLCTSSLHTSGVTQGPEPALPAHQM